MNKYENAYKLETEAGVSAFLNDYHKIAEARFYANDLAISDMLLDFEFAMRKCLTERQREVVKLRFFNDLRQVDVADLLKLNQQTIQEHIQKAVKNLASYHMILKARGE
ncbi:sigma factor-like helix-turn-helix DNA-binding protein [Priestia megaterium]|uniref:sigma factor-like helix-turn-helix DNA-binding protein n=1 Tax=Priestia megaterium TaxID=1404 RepID=UPI002857008E|nr:sigma factor-like helix-turn-helix DNA-binding protein [Priestia megaterium]MDR7207635.1 RNA polymerase sigma factor (sigma-70 family) [Priestia megaterium]